MPTRRPFQAGKDSVCAHDNPCQNSQLFTHVTHGVSGGGYNPLALSSSVELVLCEKRRACHHTCVMCVDYRRYI